MSIDTSRRFYAAKAAAERRARRIERPETPEIEAGFGVDAFDLEAMRPRLSERAYDAMSRAFHMGERVPEDVAREVAQAMRGWAVERGATHFCHWFQPLGRATGQKYDAFLAFDKGKAVDRLSGSQLIQGEPDASSFPHGGLRRTSESRGYTVWDPTVPAMVVSGVNGNTLYIPAAFVSYRGQALDDKLPLLRSMEVLNREAVALMHLLGATQVKRVVPTLGPEQEFFVVDRAFLEARPDLVACGRTLLGAAAPRGQELSDHYLGHIRCRVLSFIQDVERRLHRVGIPASTRHNEFAPAQYEIVPLFEEANVAADHNRLLMEILQETAREHDLEVLLHEKPYVGMNGSGKHCNWSMMDDRGRNLLVPGKAIVFFVAVLDAVARRGALLRASVAGAGNDHRLGGHEAPPAIMSVYLGEELTKILDDLAAGKEPAMEHKVLKLDLGVERLPDVRLDVIDRNRTSPLAFTGNRLEFRAVGASDSVAWPVTVLDTIVAESLRLIREAIEERMQRGATVEQAAREVLRAAAQRARNVVFDGDNYDEAWTMEARERGLPNLATTPEALDELLDPGVQELFSSLGVMSPDELAARYHADLERYVQQVMIEQRAMVDMVKTMVLGAGLAYQTELADSITALRHSAPFPTEEMEREVVGAQERLLLKVAKLVTAIQDRLRELEAAGERVDMAQAEERAGLVARQVLPAMAALREACDLLETMVPDGDWPLPKYRELLFLL